MNEEERLREFHKDGKKGISRYGLEKLTYPDLLLLLTEDQKTRGLIRQILNSQDEDDTAPEDLPEATEPSESVRVERSPARLLTACREVSRPLSTTQDPLRQHLKPELDLLALVRADADLAARWLPDGTESEGRQLIRLVALLAQWDQALQLWDRLAERCKSARRPATASERQILATAVAMHNLVWRDQAARLQPAGPGTSFDFKQHERGVPTGETVRAEWLPGLCNAAGQLQKKPLVET